MITIVSKIISQPSAVNGVDVAVDMNGEVGVRQAVGIEDELEMNSLI